MDIIQASDLQNNDIEKKIQEAIEWNMKEAKKCADRGEPRCCLSSGRLPVSYDRIIMNRLKEYGYREWPYPVYCGGVPQRSIFFTWRTDV